MNETKEKKGLNISTKSYITALAVIFALMVLTYILTFIIPGGEYSRTIDADGNSIIDTATEFKYIDGGLPFWKWILSPFLVLGTSSGSSLVAVIAFLLVIGGIFNSLEKCGLMKYMLNRITVRYGKNRYELMAIVILFFMAMGSFIGSFEECVPLAPIVVGLSISLGWDAITGIAMCILAAGCGFAAGVCNPFSVGIAQELAGLPMFSGMWYRIVAFVLIYVLLLIFVMAHAKKIAKPAQTIDLEDNVNPKMSRGLQLFAVIMAIGIVLVFSSGLLPFLQDYTMIIVAVMFLIAGVSSVLVTGSGLKFLGKTFKDGMISIIPAVLMILMASSIKYTMEESKIMDTVLYGAVGIAEIMPRWVVILFIYLIVLVMNFFIASGSAKAFLLIPLITPIAQVFNIPLQLCIMAYAFGDGFSNVFYPTNPVLLLSLGLSDIGYTKWVKWSWKFQFVNLILTAGLLLIGLAIGYQ